MNEITVNMTEECLFDFLLFHAYSKFSGFLINILGLAIAFMGIIMYVTDRTGVTGIIFYLIAAFLFLAGTPFQLKLRAKKQVKVNEEYNQPVNYTFCETGITRSFGSREESFSWEQIDRAVVTPKTIGIYYGTEHAMILPKQDFGNEFVPIFTTIATQLGQTKVRMH